MKLKLSYLKISDTLGQYFLKCALKYTDSPLHTSPIPVSSHTQDQTFEAEISHTSKYQICKPRISQQLSVSIHLPTHIFILQNTLEVYLYKLLHATTQSSLTHIHIILLQESFGWHQLTKDKRMLLFLIFIIIQRTGNFPTGCVLKGSHISDT